MKLLNNIKNDLCMFAIVHLNTFLRAHVDAHLFWLNLTEIVILRDCKNNFVVRNNTENAISST